MRKFYLSLVSLLFFNGINAYNSKRDYSLTKMNEVSFQENKGQVGDQFYQPRPDVKFSGKANGMVFHIRNNGVSYQLHKVESWKKPETPEIEGVEAELLPDNVIMYRIDEYWKNCNQNFSVVKEDELPGYNNYYTAVCPNGATYVKSYQGIILKDLYTNIDLHYYSQKGLLKHDYLVAPNADYTQIQIEVKGAEILLQKDGSVLLKTPLGNVEEGAPIVYQAGKKIKANWVLKNNVLSYNIPYYDKNLPLVIDPLVRSWGTYYGGTGVDYQRDMDSDGSSNVYIAGFTNTGFGNDIASIGAHQTIFGGSSYDAYLAKFNQAGVRQWGTYYGGTALDYGYGCAADGLGNSFVSGYTGSFNNISTPGCYQFAFGGSSYDGFIAKFNSAGVRQWGTYYGGTMLDYGWGCAADAAGNSYLTGYTQSTNGIATVGAAQTVFGGSSYDAFVVKFNSGGFPQWGTYCGGTSLDYGQNVDADASGNVFITGYTGSSNNITTVGSHQAAFGGSSYDAYLVKYNSAGVRQWGTYYGGFGLDYGQAVKCSNVGDIYITGYSGSSNNMASPGAHQTIFGGSSYDAYLVKFNTFGVRQWGTYYGGTALDYGQAIGTAASGNVYLQGFTGSNTGTVIATTDGWQPTFGGSSYDAYFAEFNTSGTRLYGTYYGGSALDWGYGCAVAGTSVYIGGYTSSTSGLSTPGSHQATHNGGSYDGYVAKFETCTFPLAPSNLTSPPTPTICGGTNATLVAGGTPTLTWYSSPTSTVVLGTGPNFTVGPLSAGSYSYYVNSVTCAGGPRTLITVTVNPQPTVVVTSGTACPGTTFNINPTGANMYTFIPAGGPIYSPTTTTNYSVVGADLNGCTSQTAVATITVIPSPTVTVNSGSICLGQTFTMVPAGATNYTFSSGSATVAPVVTTTYYVTGDNGGCVSLNAAISVVTVQSLPSVTVAGPNALCVGQSITLTATGAGSYSWSTGAMTPSIVVSPTATIVYTVVGTGTNSCAGPSVIKNVLVNPKPNVTISSTSTVICRGESILLTANAADTYSWNTGALTTTILVTPSVTTSYTVVGTNTATGCQSSASRTVQVNLCTGLSGVDAALLNLILYPNPTNGEFSIESPVNGKILIYNTLGQIILNSNLIEGKNDISINNFANGVYFVKINYGENTKVIRLVKD